MNLINCPACEKELSPQAITCTNCGHKIQDYPAIRILKKVALWAVGMSLGFILILKVLKLVGDDISLFEGFALGGVIGAVVVAGWYFLSGVLSAKRDF